MAFESPVREIGLGGVHVGAHIDNRQTITGGIVNSIHKAVALSTSFFAVCLGQAQAQVPSNRVKALVEECKTDQKTCEEYLLGVWDAVVMMQELGHHSTEVVCPAVGPSGSQLRLAFSQWATDADQKVLEESPRVVGAIISAKHAFPCGEKSK